MIEARNLVQTCGLLPTKSLGTVFENISLEVPKKKIIQTA